jgi:hypothetical protein
VKDDDYINRVCDVVDAIIIANKQIYEQVVWYNIVPEFPTEFGGLNHPACLLDGTEVDVPLEERSMIRKLLSCNLEELWEIKYSWSTEDLPDEDSSREIRLVLKYIFWTFSTLPISSIEHLIPLAGAAEDALHHFQWSILHWLLSIINLLRY